MIIFQYVIDSNVYRSKVYKVYPNLDDKAKHESKYYRTLVQFNYNNNEDSKMKVIVDYVIKREKME